MLKRNRKKEHYNSHLIINGEQLKINASAIRGVYPIIIEKFVEQLDICIAIHKRILVLRFDLSVNEYSDDNKNLSKFLNQEKQWLRRKYKTKNIGSVWVREQEKSKKQHYHCAFFIDGDKVRHPAKIIKSIKAKWFKYGHAPVIKNPFYYIHKHNLEDERKRAIERLSYLAKIRGKGYRNPQAKDYQTSRLSR